MASDEKVLDTIKQLIKEVKEEMKTKKVLAEGKEPEQVFKNHQKNIKTYITEQVIKALKDAER